MSDATVPTPAPAPATSVPVAAQPTQVQFPWKATLRTIVAIIIATVIMFIGVIPVALDYFGTYMSDSVKGALLWALGVLVALAGFFTRIMALPAVNSWLSKIGLGAD